MKKNENINFNKIFMYIFIIQGVLFGFLVTVSAYYTASLVLTFTLIIYTANSNEKFRNILKDFI